MERYALRTMDGRIVSQIELSCRSFRRCSSSATHLGVLRVNTSNRFGRNSLRQWFPKISKWLQSTSISIHPSRVDSASPFCPRFTSESNRSVCFQREKRNYRSFSVRDGVFRQFNGERSLNGLKNYIEFQEWQRTSPVSPYFAPDSIP